jgi:hypothetical protein
MRKTYRPYTGAIDGVSDRPLDRRGFLQAAAKFLAAIPFLGFFSGSVFGSQPDFYENAWQRRDCAADPVIVYKMVPLPGCKYDKAEVRHMAHKIFPSIDAARARRPHRGFLYGLKAVPLQRPLVNGMDEHALFCGRKDFDQRVHADRHHWRNLDIDITAVFDVVRDA